MSRDFLGGKQVIKSADTRKGGRVCSRQQQKKDIFLLNTTIEKLWRKAIIPTFLDAVATVNVLTGSNYGVKVTLSKLELVNILQD